MNKANQVHTYLIYLSRLPYLEQIYWRSFNERPKAPLAPRAIATDFKGEFYTAYDPLDAVKRITESLDEKPPVWWNPRGPELRTCVHYPVTTSESEWAEAILGLDQLVVEGFRPKCLRNIARSMGGSPDKQWKLLKLLEYCLELNGLSELAAKTIIKPLRDAHQYRNVLKGHAARDKRRDASSGALEAHGTFRAHFEDLTARCNTALREIVGTLGENLG